MNAHTFWSFLTRAWSAIGPLVGVLVGSWLARSWQRKQWALESKKAEYRELISTLSQSFHCIVKYCPYPDQIIALGHEQQRELLEAGVAGQRVIEDRIFIDKLMRAENIRERWGLLAAEKDFNRLCQYWNDLHDALIKTAHRDLGIK